MSVSELKALNTSDTKSNRIGTFDIAKFALSIMVIAIHSSLFPSVLYPWLRLAVPIFFIISSYFFFGKLKRIENSHEKNQCLIKYVKRNLILYLFYFVVLSPYTLYIRNYFKAGFLRGILVIIRSFLFASTFPASWYIQASIIGVVIIFFLSKKLNNLTLLVISALVYIFVVLSSSYWNIVSQVSVFSNAYKVYVSVFSSPVFNCPSALIWITIGKCFAEEEFHFNKKFSIVALIVSAVLLYVEWLFVRKISSDFGKDCYIFLIPTALFAFSLIKQIHINSNRITVFLGTISIIIYATHVPIIAVVSFIFRRVLSVDSALPVFLICISICLVECVVILKLEKYKYFKWLKFSH